MSSRLRHVLSPLFIVLFGVVFIVPFLFMLLTASKSQQEANDLAFSLPTHWHLLSNLGEAIKARNYMLLAAFINSTVITVVAVAIMVVVSAMVAYVLQRRPSRSNRFVDFLILCGLIIPPAIVPTIWVMQKLSLFKTIPGLVLVEVAFLMPFSVLIFRTFVSAIPRELDEAAIIDGATPVTLFLRVILPLLRPAIITVVVVQSIAVYNDFVNPLYFLPGTENSTVQLTLFNFQSQFNTRWNLLFADVLLITIPPLILFVFFQRQFASGFTAGAVKG